MDDDAQPPAAPPKAWMEAIDRAEADIAAGRVTDGPAMHARLPASIVKLKLLVSFSLPLVGRAGVGGAGRESSSTQNELIPRMKSRLPQPHNAKRVEPQFIRHQHKIF